MLLSLTFDDTGRYVAELADGTEHTTVSAANGPEAGADLLAALEDARDSELGESWWAEQGGEYRWMFRRTGDRLTVAVMWCSGTIIGWQHVFRTECGFEEFVGQVKEALARVAPASA
jgi:hypothetical protein